MNYNIITFTILGIFLLMISACSSAPKEYSESEVDAMSMEERLVAIDEAVKTNPPREMTQQERVADKESMEAMSDGNVLKSGSFEGRAHPTSGSIEIIEKDGHTLVVLSDDFKSDSGPELHIVLTEHDSPKNSRDLHSGENLDLGILKSTKGTQTYEIPADKVDKLKTATVYCKPFKVIFGSASLS